MVDDGRFRFGIEHEVAFVRPLGRAAEIADFTNTRFGDLQAVVDGLPVHHDAGLHVDLLKGKVGRWYVEGFDRYDEGGRYTGCDPKGIEIRTPVCSSIADAVGTLRDAAGRLASAAGERGLVPVTVGFNPVRAHYVPVPPLNPWEIARRACCPEEQTAHLHMVTYGPDLNISHAGMLVADLVDAGRKLTHYSPYLVPFSFSSPFFCNTLWSGLSRRTHYRTGRRPAALVFLDGQEGLVASRPSLTRTARIPSEVGRIEFKAFDPCADLDLYGSLLALLKGLVLDTTLPGRRTVPDTRLHRLSARLGFRSPHVFEGARRVLAAAGRALEGDPDVLRLEVLAAMHRARTTPADALIERYKETGDIVAALGAPAAAQPRCVRS
jgi:hypothetical protein